MFCANCGTKLDEGSKFCTNCGSAVNPTSDDNTSQYQEQNPYAPPQQQSAYQQAVTAKNPWQYFIGVFKKYADFSGRARRAEYWWFTLFSFIIGFILGFIDGQLDLFLFEDNGLFSTLWNLAVFIPSLAVAWRRMHDCDRAGPFSFIPIYGLILCCTRGTNGLNRFGPDPKLEAQQQTS